MKELAVAINGLPRIFQVGGEREVPAIFAVQQELSKMANRQIRIHTGKPSASEMQLFAAFKPLLLGTIGEVKAKVIFISGPHADQLVRLIRIDDQFKNNNLIILKPNGPKRGTIGDAIRDLDSACKSSNKQKIEKALLSFQLYLAELIKTTLVFVL